MNVSMMQPTFLPWLGYFQLIYKSDLFIFLDDFQFSVQSYHQRNKLFVNQDQVDWYTVPIKKTNAFGVSINTAHFDESRNWRKKLVNRLEKNYFKSPFFSHIYPLINDIIINEKSNLSTLNIKLIKAVVKSLDWDVQWEFRSKYPSKAVRSERVLELLKLCGATHYYSPIGAMQYLKDDGIFPVSNLDVSFQNFHIKKYLQINSSNEFFPSLSVLDPLFNVGPKETTKLINNENNKWEIWK